VSDQYVSDQNISDRGEGQPVEPAGDGGEKSGSGLWRWLAYILVAILAAGVAWFFTRDRGGEPKVGDCMAASAVTSQGGGGSERLATISCTDAQAAFKVVGVVANKRFDEANLQDCTAQWPTTVEGMWFGEEGKTGSVLCLEPVEH
jgi:hypothetical protein